jgi:2-octaprenyl-6-methoxyphenol hydroxylase
MCESLNIAACLIEARAVSHTQNSDGRAIALSYTSVLLLKHLGVWESLEPHATPIDTVHVSAQGRLGTMRCLASDVGIEYLGQVVQAPVLGGKLQMNATPLIDEVISFNTQDPAHITLTLKHNDPITATLVLACDGTDSFCRDYLHMDTAQKPAVKTALVMNMLLQKPLAYCAYQRLIKHGVCALLPLSGNKATVVLSLNNDEANNMHAMDDEALSNALKSIWGNRFGRMQVHGPRFLHPLRQVYVKKPIENRLILMGNAAHTLNPIAAQGLNLAFRDISVLYDILEDAKALQQDLGDVPEQYCQRIQPAHARMERITDVLLNMANADYLSPFHGFGLSVLQHVPGVKNKWATIFAGLDGHRGKNMTW